MGWPSGHSPWAGMMRIGMHWDLSTTPGRWEEVEGCFSSEAPSPTGNSGQCSRRWASCWPAPYLDAPSLQGQMPCLQG